MEPW